MNPNSPARRRAGANWTGPAPWLVALAGIIIIAIVAWLLWILFEDEDSAGPEVGITVEEVVNDTDTFIGERVVVSGAVNEILGDRSFTLEEDDLLIVVDEANPNLVAPVLEDSVLQVEGTVRYFDLADIEADAGIDLDDEALEDRTTDPVIIASSLSLVSEEFAEPLIEIPDVQSIETLLEDFESVQGESVTVFGRVGRGFGENAAAFQGAEAEDVVDMLLVGEVPIGLFIASVPATVTGTVVEYDASQIESEYGVELEEDLLDGVVEEGFPTIVVENIHLYPRPIDLVRELVGVRGATVSTAGEITDVVSENAFELDGEEILVFHTGDVDIIEHADAAITGEVFIFSPDIAEERLGIDLVGDYDDYEGLPAIEASEVRVVR